MSTVCRAGMNLFSLDEKYLNEVYERDNKVATIHFDQLDSPERRIMLRFAKLQILDE